MDSEGGSSSSLSHQKDDNPTTLSSAAEDDGDGDGDDHRTTTTRTWGVQHSNSLLHTIQLELHMNIKKKDTQDEDESAIIYKAPLQQGGTFLTWEHIDEHLEQELQHVEWWKQPNTNSYRTMMLRLSCCSTLENEKQKEVDNSWSLELPIHPARLRKLSKIPESFPPNSVLVYFSDESVRVTPSLHKFLVEHQLVPSPRENEEDKVVEDFDRFDDDVYAALDHATPQKEQQAQGVDSLENTPSPASSKLKRQDLPPPSNYPVEYTASQVDTETFDLRMEQQQLEAMIAQEEALLRQEEHKMDRDKEALQQFIEEGKSLSRELGLLRAEITSQAEQLRKDAFWKEAHGIKLIRELSSIYPITKDSDGKNYFICGLRLPVDGLWASIVPEEEISAALGYVCHLLVMMSKYLDVPLRHRIYANSSRSAIAQDGGSAIFPLFRARVIEREELEYGLVLLDADVECLLKSRGVEYEPTKNLLSRLHLILDQARNGSYEDLQ